MRMGVLPVHSVTVSTPLGAFRLLDAAGKNCQYRRPGRDILPELRRIDLVERVVGRVMQVEIAGAVLVEGYARKTVIEHRADVGPVRLVKRSGDDAERRQRLADRRGFRLARLAQLAVDLPDLVGAE